MTAYPYILPGVRAMEYKVLSIFLGWRSRLESGKLIILKLGYGEQ